MTSDTRLRQVSALTGALVVHGPSNLASQRAALHRLPAERKKFGLSRLFKRIDHHWTRGGYCPYLGSLVLLGYGARFKLPSWESLRLNQYQSGHLTCSAVVLLIVCSVWKSGSRHEDVLISSRWQLCTHALGWLCRERVLSTPGKLEGALLPGFARRHRRLMGPPRFPGQEQPVAI